MDEKFLPGSARKPPIIILPGLMCDSRMFAGQLAAFPGSAVVGGFYAGCDRIEAMADYALARLPARCALMGHSMGARVALEVVRKAPERVERLALVDTGIHPVNPHERKGRYKLRDLGRGEGMAALVDCWLPPMLATAQHEDRALVASLRAMAVDAGLTCFEAQIEALLHRPRVETLLPTINCPTFAIVGREDGWAPVAQHADIVAAIPGAQLRIIDGAGHMLPAEKPEAFNKVVSEWLAGSFAS
jgi:pimeloyl-ACP methyl ester carboxylesterase